LTAKEQLQSLFKIQELALEIRRAQDLIDAAPARLAEIEDRFRERNAEYVAVKDRFDELEQDQRWRSGELGTLGEKRTKLMDDLMQVKNQREYSAMLKEIDTVKAEISDHEDAVLKDMEELEKLGVELKGHEQTIQQERDAVRLESAAVEAEVEKCLATAERLSADRADVEAKLPMVLRKSLHRLESRRQGVFLAKAENWTCQSCFVRIRPQVFQEIKQGDSVHACGSCKRFLYYAPSMENSAPRAEANGVEAVNGGAV